MKLVLQTDKSASKEFLINDRAIVFIGRASGNDVQLAWNTISRKHAKITKKLGEFFIEDLGSTSGTMLNDKPLKPYVPGGLHDGDVIRIGKIELVFFSAESESQNLNTQCLAAEFARKIFSAQEEIEPCVKIVRGARTTKELCFKNIDEKKWAGRSPECDLVVDGRGISRKHIAFHRTIDGVYIEDGGSKNGITVNGRRISKKQLLCNGDEIIAGESVLVFVDPLESLLNSETKKTEKSSIKIEKRSSNKYFMLGAFFSFISCGAAIILLFV